MTVDFTSLIVVVAYFLGLMAIGVWTSKKVKTSEDMLVAGRNLGFWVFVLLIVSSICSGMTILGVSGLGYTTGWPSIWEPIFVPLSAAVCILFFGTKLHAVSQKTGYVTIQDYFAHRYYSPRGVRGVSATIGILVSMIYLVGQYIAISIVLKELFGIPYQLALLTGALIVMAYTILGGLYAIGLASLIQGLLIIIGVILVGPPVIQAAGGLTHINTVLATIDPNFVQLSFPQMHPPYAKYAFLTPEYLVSFFLMLTLGLSVAPHVVNNILAARDTKYFKWAPLAAFVIYVFIMYTTKIIGFASRVMVKEGAIALPTGVANPSDYSFIETAKFAFPDIFAPMMAVIVLSAVMSTTDRLMLTIGSYVSWDLYKQFLNKDASDKSITLLSRVAIALSAAITLAIAWNYTPELLAWLTWLGIGIMFACFVAPLVGGLYWRGATKEGAILSMLVGLLAGTCATYYHNFVWKLPVHYSICGFIASVITLVVVSLLTKKADPKILDETMTGLYINPRKEEQSIAIEAAQAVKR